MATNTNPNTTATVHAVTVCGNCSSLWAGALVQCLECGAYADDMAVAFVDDETYVEVLRESDRHFDALYREGRV